MLPSTGAPISYAVNFCFELRALYVHAEWFERPDPKMKSRESRFCFATAEHLGPMYVPRSQISPCAFTEILVFDSWWHGQTQEPAKVACGGGLEYCFFRPRR